jgi:hypothetical protein
MQDEVGCYNLVRVLLHGQSMVVEVTGMEKVCKVSDVPKATMKGFAVNGR